MSKVAEKGKDWIQLVIQGPPCKEDETADGDKDTEGRGGRNDEETKRPGTSLYS